MRSLYLWLGGSLLAAAITLNVAAAQRYESPNYTIDASVGNSFGGTGTSASYELVSSGGESIIGNGAGGSYMLTEGYVSQLEQGLQLNVQPNGLIASYGFEEASGQIAYDSSSNSNDGNLIGGASRVAGKLGDGGVALNAAGERVEITHSTVLNSSEMTATIWVKLDSTFPMQPSNYIGLISKRASNSGFAMYMFKGQEEVQVSIGDGTTRSIYDPSVAAYDWTTWHQVGFTFENNELVVYVDGEEVGRQTLTHGLAGSTSDLWIGDITDYANSYPQGVLDGAKLYNRALSENEIKAAYDAENAGFSTGLSFPDDLIAGSSATTEADVIVQTDAPGYLLAINQNNDLTDGSNTIPAIAGTIASPLSWSEGTTKGLGFTVVSSNATSVPAKWNAGNSYAQLPGSSTEFYTRTGFSGGTKDLIDVRYRVDVTSTQVAGKYSNQVMYTGTITP